ncbi:MAG: hypothetical protein A3J97_09705 [Spirochaetes bacterium RIFOXYC1_FULL_54_7]|nr:MAG: hypothetical protein A3J97_09705 [Spirochaetes bacterium RIFOXYC1_FULL_54_7]
MKRNQILILMTILVFTSSCTLFDTPPEQSEPSELSDFRAKYLTSFDILNGTFSQSGRALMPFNLPVVDESQSQARATVPVYSLPGESFDLSGITSTTPAEGTLNNYPEAGQTSAWTVESTAVSNVYLVKVTTVFPSYDPREKQEEWYYIKDQTPGFPDTADGSWTNADPVVDGTGTLDSTHRERNRLYFRDGSEQNEVIVDARNKPNGFGTFDMLDSLDYPDVFFPLTDTNAEYSSVVVYTRVYEDDPAYTFWSGKRVQSIVGIRYYTEHLNFVGSNPSHLIGTTIAFEKAATSLYTESGSFVNPYSSLFLPDLDDYDPDSGDGIDLAFLSLNVIRQETTYVIDSYDDGTGAYTLDYDLSTRDTRAKARVLNIPLQQDSYITLINDEVEAISSSYDSLWIPQADDAYYISPNSAPLVNTKTSNLAVTTADSQPVSIIVDSVPLGDLGELYVAVSEGTTSTIDEATDNGIVDAESGLEDLTGVAEVLEFTGAQGALIEDPLASGDPYTYNFTEAGTVQAWVYVDKQSNYGGIVHAGIRQDFKDEIISLQFVGNNNTPGFAVVAQGPNYHYDLVQSSEKLKKSTWYYLTATWDRAANNMSIYVNGVSRGTRTFSSIKLTTSKFAVDSPVVVGSQFYDGTQVLSGYYGTEGRINGVLIDDEAWTANRIKTFYDANKDKTANW